jgi:hypothetical protein
MAFTGTPTIVQISDRLVRVTGLSLAAGAAGVFGLSESTVSGAVKMPAAFKPANYQAEGHTVTLQDSVQCAFQNAATGVATAIPLAVVKSGSTDEDFAITVTNTHGSLASPAQEFMISFH